LNRTSPKLACLFVTGSAIHNVERSRLATTGQSTQVNIISNKQGNPD